VDACTVTTLDVITAFAVPNLNCPSQAQSIFSGLAASRVAPLDLSLSHFGLATIYFCQPFQPSTHVTLEFCFTHVNALFARIARFL
jgi:hypothetical protein